MNNQKINKFMYKVSVSEDPVDVYNAWNCVKSEYGTYKTIVSLKKYSKSVIDKVIRDKFDDIDSGFVSYFEASILYFVSNKGMYEMIQNGTVNYKIIIQLCLILILLVI